MDTIKKLVMGTTLLSVAVCGCASAEEERLTVTTSAGGEVFVKGYAWVNRDCEVMPPPPIFIDRPPRHGTLCSVVALSRLDPPVVAGSMRCVGRQIDVPQIVYLPKPNYIGQDDAHYVVKFPTADYGVKVALTVMPKNSTQPATVPRDISEALSNKMQPPGLLLPCAALVS
jgi:hypothetical protein